MTDPDPGPLRPVSGGNPAAGRCVPPLTPETRLPGPPRPVRPGNRDGRPGSAAETEN